MYALAQSSYVVDSIVGCAIDFNHIRIVATFDLLARWAIQTGRNGHAVFAVQRFCQNARGAGFAGATWPHQQICLANPLLFYGPAKRSHNVILADDFGECARTVLSGQDAVTHSREACLACRAATARRGR